MLFYFSCRLFPSFAVLGVEGSSAKLAPQQIDLQTLPPCVLGLLLDSACFRPGGGEREEEEEDVGTFIQFTSFHHFFEPLTFGMRCVCGVSERVNE